MSGLTEMADSIIAQAPVAIIVVALGVMVAAVLIWAVVFSGIRR